MCTARELSAEIKRENGGSLLIKLINIIRVTGLSRSQVNKLVDGLPAVGGRGVYFVDDVAKALIRHGMNV